MLLTKPLCTLRKIKREWCRGGGQVLTVLAFTSTQVQILPGVGGAWREWYGGGGQVLTLLALLVQKYRY
jgi:hypothetical protein